MKNQTYRNLAIFALIAAVTAAGSAIAQIPGHEMTITVDPLGIERFQRPVDVPLDLTAYLTNLGASLDPATLRVVETSAGGGIYVDTAVPFQFDPDPDFDPALNAAGTLVFLPADAVTGLPAAGYWPEGVRYFKLLFDVVGGCPGCPGPPPVAAAVTVDSLIYENQQTYLVETPAGDWYYHRDGGGFASLIDPDGQDWIGFHDIAGSKASGEYRGIPNLVYVPGGTSYFHPGFDNAISGVVSAGPLKVVIRSVADDPANPWTLRWDIYQHFARLTVESTGTSNGGDYWFLYEGTVGGSMDAGDEVVRSDGTTTSAYDYADVWEEAIADPEWTYFRDTSADRYLYVSNDVRDTALDSYRPMGNSAGATPQMTVFGLGRVLNTSANALVPRMSGVGRTFTVGLAEDPLTADGTIASASQPLGVSVGAPTTYVSGAPVPDLAVTVLEQNHPNPFNPRTSIRFVMATGAHARLEVFDARGFLVRTLVDGPVTAGAHTIPFDGADLSSGVYLYRLTTPGGTLQRKMMLVR